MGFIEKLTFRYNPQSIEKQVRKWPVLFSEKDFYSDLVLRLNQLHGSYPFGWFKAFSVEMPFEKSFIEEYGIDACRLAIINSNNQNNLESFLEPSYKWIAKLHETYFKKSINSVFNPLPWLEALVQQKDHIVTRKAARLALALVMKAFKDAPPSSELTDREKHLVYSCIYPFLPIFSTSIINESSPQYSLNDIIERFNEFICIRVSLEKGGWHWQVFSRKIFEADPVLELSKIKWINKAIKNKNIIIKKEEGGIRICFS